jgi:hypothetical protein
VLLLFYLCLELFLMGVETLLPSSLVNKDLLGKEQRWTSESAIICWAVLGGPGQSWTVINNLDWT